jgi:hypothetical protein
MYDQGHKIAKIGTRGNQRERRVRHVRRLDNPGPDAYFDNAHIKRPTQVSTIDKGSFPLTFVSNG